MNIKKAIITAAALFAAVAICHGKLTATPSGAREDEEEIVEEEEEEEEENTLDLNKLERGATVSFSFEDEFPETVNGYEVLTEFLPDGVSLEWTGKKLKAPKAGKIKYSKKDEGFIDKKKSDNPSGLSVKVNKKKGTISGSFKIYVAKSEKKLKSYKAKFSGKVGESLSVTLKKKVLTTATISE